MGGLQIWTTDFIIIFLNCFRPGWSPDGSMLVSAHAMNGGGPTAQIIDRGSWKTQRDFVGHKKAVTCTRFSNNLFQINNR